MDYSLSDEVTRPGRLVAWTVAIAIGFALTIQGLPTPGIHGGTSVLARLALSGTEVEPQDSLQELFDASDAVVVGTMIGSKASDPVTIDPYYGAVSYLQVEILIAEAIKGPIFSGERLQLDLFVLDGSTVTSVRESLPGTKGFFFLRDKARSASLFGGNGSLAGRNPMGASYRFVYSGGAMVDAVGRVEMPLADSVRLESAGGAPTTSTGHEAPEAYSGAPFGAAVEAARAARSR